MIKEFENLTPAETAAMFDAIPNIIILVAAADDDMDETELAAAQKLADIRSYSSNAKLSAYYETIDEGLQSRIQELYSALPKNLEERETVLFERLGELNAILGKLESPFDFLYYDTFLSFSHFVAEAHGGFLRYFTVGPEEHKVVDLPMLNKIEKPEEHEGLL